MSSEGQCFENTDREIYRGPSRAEWGDADRFYADSIHVTEAGGIGFNCGGHVIVMPLRKWFEAAQCLSYAELIAGLLMSAVIYVPSSEGLLRSDIRAALAKTNEGRKSGDSGGSQAPDGGDDPRALRDGATQTGSSAVKQTAAPPHSEFETNSKFSDFIRNAEGEERAAVFERVIDKSIERQQDTLRHQSGKKPQAANIMALVRRLPNLSGEEFFATRDAIQAALEQLDEECVHQVSNEDARDAARYRFIRQEARVSLGLSNEHGLRFWIEAKWAEYGSAFGWVPKALDAAIDAKIAPECHVAGKKS